MSIMVDLGVPALSEINSLSFRGYSWKTPEDAVVDGFTLSTGQRIPPEVVSIARNRGVDDLRSFFEPKLKSLMPDPFFLCDMEKAVERFCVAVEEAHGIGIIGDYDVDGATSTSQVLLYLRSLGHESAHFYIPQRLTEGYGANIGAVDTLASQGIRLLMILDSGTVATDGPINRAVELGIDVIVIDHHEPGPGWSKPNALLVNPKRPEEDGSLAHLCTAGLVTLFLAGANRRFRASARPEVNLFPLMGLTALGTVADLVPLKGLNRAYVTAGLQRMKENPGIRTLMELNDAQEPSVYACGFIVGPCINAGGRLSDTRQGTTLLTGEPGAALEALGAQLKDFNEQRKQVEKAILTAAAAPFVDLDPSELPDVIVVASPDWHPGVVGIVASRLKEMFDRTAVVIGQSGKGSGRSVGGFNLGEAFIEARSKGLLVKGGGHAAAGGLTITFEQVDAFRTFLVEKAKGGVREPQRVDIAMPLAALGEPFVRGCEYLAPFGMGNPRPRIRLSNCIVKAVEVLKNGHIRVSVHDKTSPRIVHRIMLFRGLGSPLANGLDACIGAEVEVLVNAEYTMWNGREYLSLKLEDARLVQAFTMDTALSA